MQNTITDSNKKFLYDLTAARSMDDFIKTNPDFKPFTKTGKPRQAKSYSLSDKTLEALEMYKTAIKKDITEDEIETVKAFILKNKLHPED